MKGRRGEWENGRMGEEESGRRGEWVSEKVPLISLIFANKSYHLR
jgi:hypothetical protein